MSDQAHKIQEIAHGELPDYVAGSSRENRKTKIYSVVSGKGGVGKSNVAINLGISMTRFGHRVLLIDADMGLANLDLLLGLTPNYNLMHLLTGKKLLEEVMITGPSGIKLIPSNSNGRIEKEVSQQNIKEIMGFIRENPDVPDTVFIDTGGGITDNILDFLLDSDEVILITTPEPTSIMDSYGIIKSLSNEKDRVKIKLIVNMAEDSSDALHVFETMGLITRQFFNVEIENLGWISYDHNVARAVRQQQPFVLLYPASRASKCVSRIAMQLADYDVDFITERGVRRLINRLISFFR